MRGDDDLVARLQESRAIAEGDQVDRLGGAAGEDDLAGCRAFRNLGNSLPARPRNSRSRARSASRRRDGRWRIRFRSSACMASMHRARLLRRRGAVEKHQAMAVTGFARIGKSRRTRSRSRIGALRRSDRATAAAVMWRSRRLGATASCAHAIRNRLAHRRNIHSADQVFDEAFHQHLPRLGVANAAGAQVEHGVLHPARRPWRHGCTSRHRRRSPIQAWYPSPRDRRAGWSCSVGGHRPSGNGAER